MRCLLGPLQHYLCSVQWDHSRWWTVTWLCFLWRFATTHSSRWMRISWWFRFFIQGDIHLACATFATRLETNPRVFGKFHRSQLEGLPQEVHWMLSQMDRNSASSFNCSGCFSINLHAICLHPADTRLPEEDSFEAASVGIWAVRQLLQQE